MHDATSENVLVDLQVDEGGTMKNRLALIQEVQHHPYEDTVLHIDFHEVLATEKLRARVPIRPVGEPAGVKNGGGVLEYVMRELHVECLPQDLPDVIEVNVEKLEISQSIHIGDITPPPGVALLDAKGQTVFLVAAPITEEELAAMTEAAAAPSAEPEVITAKKEEGEEGAVVSKAKAKQKPSRQGRGEGPGRRSRWQNPRRWCRRQGTGSRSGWQSASSCGWEGRSQIGSQTGRQARSQEVRRARRHDGVGQAKAGGGAGKSRPGIRWHAPQHRLRSTGWARGQVGLFFSKQVALLGAGRRSGSG